jgi:pyruvate dehydrogenase E1 component beta subunit
MGAEIAALAAERLITDLKGPVVRVSGYDTIMPFYKMENWFIPDESRIRAGVEKALEF